MVVPFFHSSAAEPSPQETMRVTLLTGLSSVREVCVIVPVRSTHDVVYVPLGALRSTTSWVMEAAGPERWFIGVTVRRTWATPVRSTEADHDVAPTVLPASGAPLAALVRATTYVVAPVAAFHD